MKKLVLLYLFCLPLKHIALNSPFGYRIHPVTGEFTFHSGVDLHARHDTVFAVLAGRIAVVTVNNYLGVFIRIRHSEFQSIYGHLSQVFVIPGDTVNAGTPIAITGATGRVTGEHLHFSIKYKQRFIDPLAFLNALLNH